MTILMLRPEDRIDCSAPLVAQGAAAVPEAAGVAGAEPAAEIMAAGGADLSPAVTSGCDRADWIVAGFDLLAEEGWSALSPARIAARLSGSEAGFFLYFSDLDELLQAMFDLWERLALGPLAAELPTLPPDGSSSATREAARARLAELADEGEGAPAAAIETALRERAASDPRARAAVERVDRHRLGGLSALLQAAGLSEPQARQRAEVFYAARIGLDYLHGTTGLAPAAPMRALAAAVLGLRKAG
ncbi:TetR/AcrR family transcriptional regulator [Pseudogemmobacter humi]|uniref:TetR/AcrR family transcriptional regulator n=1 Tax=Pseudogemmobacter humi TaxID=2483812 RepID=UPI0013584BF6|nr:TetR/AcrR family transcriptional regulator [Pseudogemmobacter humi]